MKPEHLELAALKDSLPMLAKNQLSEVDSLSKAWEILTGLYGDKKEIRAKLKAKIASINLKATYSPNKEIELLDQIQFISVKIKAARGIN